MNRIHTPGPWRVTNYPNSRQSHVATSSTENVRFLETSRSGISTEMWNANLRLIAAAPDLLDACLLVQETKDGCYLGDYARKRLEEAITKALGEEVPHVNGR